MACVGNHKGGDVFEIRLKRFSHCGNGVLPADCQETDGEFAGELFLVEFHVIDDPSAVVEGRIHAPFPRVRRDIGSYVARRHRSRLVHFVFEPPSNVDVLLPFGQFGRQIGKHLEYEVPLSLVVRELNVVQ